MTWIKICGITNKEDALHAVEAGADALGFVFYEKSARNVDPGIVAAIISHLPTSIEKVGVFVNHGEEVICGIADEVGLTAVQFHGHDEDPHVSDLLASRRPDLKMLVAVPMLRPEPEGQAMIWNPQSVYAFLADSSGGSGRSFDWAANKAVLDRIGQLSRVAIAGGLTPRNVAEAIGILHPWGVDVSSGVELAPGKKDHQKIRAFVDAVRSADRV